jgi:hypothetical protein
MDPARAGQRHLGHVERLAVARLRGHISEDRDPFGPFEFERAATELLGAEIELFSDEVLRNEHVIPDLVTASPL